MKPGLPEALPGPETALPVRLLPERAPRSVLQPEQRDQNEQRRGSNVGLSVPEAWALLHGDPPTTTSVVVAAQGSGGPAGARLYSVLAPSCSPGPHSRQASGSLYHCFMAKETESWETESYFRMEGWRTGISGGGKRKEKEGWWGREAAHGPVCEAPTSVRLTGDVGRWRRPELGFCCCLLDKLALDMGRHESTTEGVFCLHSF